MPVSSDLHSVTGVSGAFEGVVISFNPEIVYETAAYDTFHDTIGNTGGARTPQQATSHGKRPTSVRTGLQT